MQMAVKKSILRRGTGVDVIKCVRDAWLHYAEIKISE